MSEIELAQYNLALRNLERAQEAVSKLKKIVSVDCSHPFEYVVPFRWEHDSGYGRQSWITGQQCSICYAVDSWCNGNFRKW